MSNVEVLKDRNTLRRERYARDASYRKEIIGRERAKRTGPTEDCRQNIAGLRQFGEVRSVLTNDGTPMGDVYCFTVEEAARALLRTPKSLYKYFNKNLFPRPEHKFLGRKEVSYSVYLMPELLALMQVFGAHQAETPYYGAYHTDTRQALFEAMANASQ